MSSEKFCDIHKNTPTRLSCVSCGKPICLECMVQAPVGFKCPDCARGKKSHIEEITAKQYIIGGFSGIIIGAGTGYIWHYLSMYGALISLLVAYAVGYFISKAISASIGNKIGFKIQLFAAIVTVISMAYNPIIFIFYKAFPYFYLIKIIGLGIAVWAAIRHFRL